MIDVVWPLVLSHLEDCPVIWSSAAEKNQRKKIEITQNRAARLLLYCSFPANVCEMHKQLSWLTVEAKPTFAKKKSILHIKWALVIWWCHVHEQNVWWELFFTELLLSGICTWITYMKRKRNDSHHCDRWDFQCDWRKVFASLHNS